jgi:SAM-dependent methyltransferase
MNAFCTDFRYTDRITKARYVALKYQPILTGALLDVGADECHIKSHLAPDVRYHGIDLGGSPDQQFDLESGPLPFPDASFDCVLCLDVLEHLENIHAVFDDLCRVTRRYVIVSLPNPWTALVAYLERTPYRPDRNLKFYGLPLAREPDRHKWFFSASEARSFVIYRAKKNGMTVIQHDTEGSGSIGLPQGGSWRTRVRRWQLVRARKLLFRADVNWPDLYEGTLWWVLRKPETAT